MQDLNADMLGLVYSFVGLRGFFRSGRVSKWFYYCQLGEEHVYDEMMKCLRELDCGRFFHKSLWAHMPTKRAQCLMAFKLLMELTIKKPTDYYLMLHDATMATLDAKYFGATTKYMEVCRKLQKRATYLEIDATGSVWCSGWKTSAYTPEMNQKQMMDAHQECISEYYGSYWDTGMLAGEFPAMTIHFNFTRTLASLINRVKEKFNPMEPTFTGLGEIVQGPLEEELMRRSPPLPMITPPIRGSPEKPRRARTPCSSCPRTGPWQEESLPTCLCRPKVRFFVVSNEHINAKRRKITGWKTQQTVF